MKAFRLLSVFVLTLALTASVSSCKKVSDADLKAAVETVLASSDANSAVIVDVKDKIATLSGVVETDSAKTLLETATTAVKGIKSVVNLVEVTPPAPDFTAIDTAIQTGLTDALKDFKKASATVKDGVITLKGEIKKTDLVTLMQTLSALSPVQILTDSITVK